MRVLANIVFAAAVLFWSVSPVVATPRGTDAAKYAAIVIDANSGKTLFEYNANARRYPASLTKMMTLYLLFEAMQSGRVSANTPIPVSAYAASRPPTKIGFKPGQTITAENAAKALITKSANDVATAIGEYLAGSEKGFARMMTLKARRLGMMNTNFTNASGLPDSQNYSTARDMAILSLALREHFPQRYYLFSTTRFALRGQVIRGHNRLLNSMKGVDGIKTGYTRMSGFNLASSVRQGRKSIVGVVMGGQSASLRDAHMADLLARNLQVASSKKAAGPLLASLSPSVYPAAETATATVVNATLPAVNSVPVPLAKAAVITASVSDREHDAALLTALATTSGSTLPAAVAAVDGIVAPQAVSVPLPVRKAEYSAVAPARDMVTTASINPSSGQGWIIQIAAAPSKNEADKILDNAAKTAGTVLAKAKPYTQVFERGNAQYYRARFSGFNSQQEAVKACKTLVKASFACFAIRG